MVRPAFAVPYSFTLTQLETAMRAYTLKQQNVVAISGHSILGKPTDPILFWRHTGCYWNDQPLLDAPLKKELRKLSLTSRNGKFPVFEHVGPIFATGLRDVMIDTGNSIPHFSRTKEIWDVLKPHIVETDVELTPITLREKRGVQFMCGRDRYIQYLPSTDGKLTIRVDVAYKDILGGRPHTKTYVFPDMDLLERVFAAPTLGRVPRLFEPVISRLDFLPIVREAAWVRNYPTDEDKLELLRLICDHRVLDILGALALATPAKNYLCGYVRSHKGGHACDIKLVHELRRPGTLVEV